ncbi:hypothetical protein ABT063_27745 [Streptomyces sp. NPDC002838]|uniref:hypothetical protein n=1 Tax=Streptomyces sp. NPDC002838 TaxID=3154436 RepID=UPI0033297A8A
MYALIVPASAPFVLLATVLGLSWWEDHVLPAPPAEPLEALLVLTEGVSRAGRVGLAVSGGGLRVA